MGPCYCWHRALDGILRFLAVLLLMASLLFASIPAAACVLLMLECH
jgi:hypothetical protein